MTKTVDWLENGEDHGFYLIEDGSRRRFYPAIIGLAKDNSHVAYSREKLIKCFMLVNDWSYEEADEWVSYNTERALPYYGSTAPVILDVNYVNSRNKTYIPLKISLDI